MSGFREKDVLRGLYIHETEAMDLADKLYLVTGAAGHLGTAVTDRLVREGREVRALCVDGETHLPAGTQVFYGDVCAPDTLGAFFGDTGGKEITLIHCAGIVSIHSRFDQKVWNVNVNGTKNVTDLCVKNGVGKMIYVSSVHAIPVKAAGETMTEDCDIAPEKVEGLYARTKAEATRCVLDAASGGLDAEIVFPSGIIGPFDYGRSHTNALVADYVSRRLTSAVKGGYDFVDVRDVAQGIVSCADRGTKGEGYILSGGYHTIREILFILHEITGQKEIRSFFPMWFVDSVAPLCELYYRIKREPPLFTRYSMYTLACNSLFSHEKATRCLGFSPRGIRETLYDTVEWLRQTGRINA